MSRKIVQAVDLQKVGRTFVWKDIVWFGLSGTGVVFNTNAKSATFTLIGDSSANGQATEGIARIGILVDGIRHIETMMDRPEIQLRVEINNSDGKMHTIQLIKLSECAMSTAGVRDVALEGSEEIVVENGLTGNKKIEFIGDSITCGYGIDMEDPLVGFRTDTEDCTKAYAYKAAKLLGADYSLFSLSGYGIITGFTDNDELHRDQLIPSFYDMCGFSYAHPVYQGEDGPAFESVKWDFSKYVPDMVVINLGTNDSSYCKSVKDRLDWYKKDYKSFLSHIRELNPKADILCCLGLMDAGYNVKALGELVDEFVKENNDDNVYYLAIPTQLPMDGLVSDYHPTKVSHLKAAELVAARIKEIWK